MNAVNLKCLVVGGDGFIGSKLVERLRSLGASVTATTRRAVGVDKNSLRLDLASELELPSWTYPNGEVAFLCAGVTSIATCEAEPLTSRRINAVNTLTLARKLYASGMRIVFLSSNAVFDGHIAKREEGSVYCPSTEYGRQKVSVEQGLMAFSGGVGSVAIIRLSKVLASSSGVIAEFIKQFTAREPCAAFDDLRMSPISLSYVLDAILTIAMSQYSGVFHLSGAEEMTYADFARRLAGRLGVSQDLVRPVAAGAKVVYRPEHPALSMKRTSELLGISPESTDHLLKQLLAGH